MVRKTAAARAAAGAANAKPDGEMGVIGFCDTMAPIHRIVLTGGPCGGKSTALARLSGRLESFGFRVFLVPEAATLLFSGGASLAGASAEQIVAFQGNLIRLQLSLEDSFVRLAQSSDAPSVVVCDRGATDARAYMPESSWQALLDENGWNVVALRDRRYDAVIHMVTAAEGAEAFYTTSNNTARTESPAQARALDAKLRDAWLGHPHLRVIDNSSDFADKVRRVVEAVCRVTGVPEPVEVERKFLVQKVIEPLPVRAEEIEIEQTYLRTSDGSEARVRRRGQRGSFVYTHTVKRPLREGQRVEVERSIPAREYVALLAQADPAMSPVKKRRTCFLWEGHYFELDRFESPRPGLVVLEVELDDPSSSVPLPPFLSIEREVTSEPAYSNAWIARSAAT